MTYSCFPKTVSFALILTWFEECICQCSTTIFCFRSSRDLLWFLLLNLEKCEEGAVTWRKFTVLHGSWTNLPFSGMEEGVIAGNSVSWLGILAISLLMRARASWENFQFFLLRIRVSHYFSYRNCHSCPLSLGRSCYKASSAFCCFKILIPS